MPVRPIRLLGDPVLRTIAESVTSFDAELRALVRDLADAVAADEGRAAVAAPQIGVSARVFAYAIGGASGHLINPVVIAVEGEQDGAEGCLSVPGFAFPTRRAMYATATGFDQYGEPQTISGGGLLARALCHETDHLDGVLYLDRLTGQVRREALRAIRGEPRRRR